ncbi:MAG: hypothetical protein PHQ14_03120 [Chromatiales bacterium]|nr:hypothetical protein [Chromatiales bacterium]
MSVERALAGWLLAGGVMLAVAQSFVPGLSKLAPALPIWLAGALLWRHANPRTRRQALVLLSLGIGGMLWGFAHGGPVDLRLALAANTLLIAMLAAVSFLRLVARPIADADERLPQGRRAVWGTLLGVHLFGAVINLSVVFIMGDRLAARRPLDARQFALLSRGFAAAAFWSPFFAAMAAALTYAPGARLPMLLTMGLPLAVLALVVTVSSRSRARDVEFTGYPMHFGALWLPATLALLVLLVHAIRPDWPVLVVICLLAPLLSIAYALLHRTQAAGALRRHVERDLPGMSNELLLFLAAGVMAAGVHALMAGLGGWLPFDRFGGVEAALTLFAMYALAFAGVHPVINIAVLGTLLAPLDPDPTLLAMTFLCAWATGVASSPFSGMNLALQGRYHIDPLDILRWNGPYSLLMVTLSAAVLMLYAWQFP